MLHEIADFINTPPPTPHWDTYLALMVVQFVSLRKYLSVHLVGIGKTLQQVLENVSCV